MTMSLAMPSARAEIPANLAPEDKSALASYIKQCELDKRDKATLKVAFNGCVEKEEIRVDWTLVTGVGVASFILGWLVRSTQ